MKFLLELRSSLEVDRPKQHINGITKHFLDSRSLSHYTTRQQEHARGYTRVFESDLFVPSYLSPTNNNFDILISDNTVTTLPDYIPIPKSCTPIYRLRNHNLMGQFNKGAGAIEQWKWTTDVFANYDYIISFEPRQYLKSFIFFEEFVECPQNTFAWGSPQKQDFYTGLFALEAKELIKFTNSTVLQIMVNESISLELALMNYVNDNKLKYKLVDNLDLIRFESWHNRELHH